MLKEHLRKDKTIVTSVRHLTRDQKNPLVRNITKLAQKRGLAEDGQCLDPETNIAKVIFFSTQLAYTLVTIVHTNLLFGSYIVSCLYIILIFGVGVWNGASYYIEIFSNR